MATFPTPNPRAMWADLQRLLNLLDRVLNVGGEDWPLESLLGSRWAPPEGSPTARDLRLLISRTATFPMPGGGPVTVDAAYQLLEREVFDAPLQILAPSELVMPDVHVPDPAPEGEQEAEPTAETPRGDAPAAVAGGADGSAPVEGPADGAPLDLDFEGPGGDALSLLLAPALGSASDQDRDGDGGWFSDGATGELPTEDLRRLRAVFERHLRATDAGIEGEGRTDWGRFTERLVTRQGGLTRDRRAERGPARGIAFLPDVSGSCADISGMTLAVSWQLARRYARFVVLPHSNGYHSPADAPPPPDLRPASRVNLRTPDEWEVALHEADVEWVVALGDWDASSLYGQLAARGFKVLWMDPRRGASSRPVNSPADKSFPKGASPLTAARMSYWVGADSIRTITQAVEAGFRSLARTSTSGVDVK
jgi:hypothetical protein